MKYFVNLVDQSRSEFGKSNGWHQTYWELESKERAIELHKDIYQNIGKNYDLTKYEEAQRLKEKFPVIGVIFIEKETNHPYTEFRYSHYKKEAYDAIYEYLKQNIGEEKINHSIK